MLGTKCLINCAHFQCCLHDAHTNELILSSLVLCLLVLVLTLHRCTKRLFVFSKQMKLGMFLLVVAGLCTISHYPLSIGVAFVTTHITVACKVGVYACVTSPGVKLTVTCVFQWSGLTAFVLIHGPFHTRAIFLL